MKDICLALPLWAHPLVFAAVFAWEFWLGKKKCGSTIGVVVHAIQKLRSENV